MSAFHVVVRPRPNRATPPALGSLYGLFDVIVDGVNVTARIGEGFSLSLLGDLARAVATLASGRKDRVSVPLYTEEDVWELGLEATGDDVLITVYRTGPLPEVAVFERRVSFAALREGVLAAAADAEIAPSTPKGVVEGLRFGQKALTDTAPARPRRQRPQKTVCIAPARRSGIAFTTEATFRCAAPSAPVSAPESQVERADLHALLVRGDVMLLARDREAPLPEVHLFLLAESLLALAEDGLDAWQNERPVFRRVQVGTARIGIRRSPGEGPLDLSVASPGLKPGAQRVTFPAVHAADFAGAAIDFARELVRAFEDNDPSQRKNLRLKALRATIEGLSERVDDTLANDSLQNPEPESYRSYAPRRPLPLGQGAWAKGGKIRFVPKWVATIPHVDLKSTFLCGDRLLVGSLRETACLDRQTGSILWRAKTGRGGSVVTPFGLARIEPDGRIVQYDLESGEVRFAVRIAPRAAGGATGAVVDAPGLPKLLMVAEGDRHITALDLVSGEPRWRYTAKRPSAFRMRRAGKLLLVTAGDSELLALDVSTGDVVWRVRDRLPFAHSIALDHESVFAVSGGTAQSFRLHHVDPWSGELRYSVTLDEAPLPHQPPLLAGDSIVVPTRDKKGVGALALDRATGERLWEQPAGFASPLTAWLAIDGLVLVNSNAGVFTCLDAKTGSVRYSHVFARGTDGDQPRRLEPVLRSGALFVPQHEVHVVRPVDGDVIGAVPCDLIPDLLRVDETCSVYIGEESGHMAAFGAASRLTLVK